MWWICPNELCLLCSYTWNSWFSYFCSIVVHWQRQSGWDFYRFHRRLFMPTRLKMEHIKFLKALRSIIFFLRNFISVMWHMKATIFRCQSFFFWNGKLPFYWKYWILCVPLTKMGSVDRSFGFQRSKVGWERETERETEAERDAERRESERGREEDRKEGSEKLSSRKIGHNRENGIYINRKRIRNSNIRSHTISIISLKVAVLMRWQNTAFAARTLHETKSAAATHLLEQILLKLSTQ